MAILVLAGVGCGAPAPERQGERAEALASCNDTSVSIQLRAFIPQTLCDVTDSIDNSDANICNGGFFQQLSPLDGLCFATFHGDHRSFASEWEASHRLRAIVNVPTQRLNDCAASGLSRSADCDASHRCACTGDSTCEFKTCRGESATAPVATSIDDRTCSGTQLVAHYQVHAGYPLELGSPDIYDKVEVLSTGGGSANWGLFGASQQYTVNLSHTPFPFHELIVRYACGQKTASLYTYSATDCGPSLFNLGDSVKDKITAQRSFAIVFDPNNGISLQPAGTQPPGVCGVVPSGQSLFQGDSISSCSGGYRLTMQGDGNLVLYNADGSPRWAAGTNGRGGVVVRMQADGNLVVYTAQGTPIWASNTNGHGGARLAIQDDGNLVVYQGTQPLWASNTPVPKPPSNPCGNAGDGDYCGSSTQGGFVGGQNPDTLFVCANHAVASTTACTAGCIIAPPNQADSCRPTDPCVNAGDGNYCWNSTQGGFTGEGKVNTLYTCSGQRTTSMIGCTGGCSIMPSGQPDQCAGATCSGAISCGGHCCAAHDQFCGVDGACCDGVSCSGSCPC